MQKEFIPYEQALELKELGFDYQCVNYYSHYGNGQVHLNNLVLCSKIGVETNNDKGILAPLYQQAFRWFREKYGLYHTIWPEFYKDGINFNWQILFWYLPKDEWTKYVISDRTMEYEDNGEYPTQEEAELACLEKLIEIVKSKKD
jgi:hypothetical protein